MRVNKGIRDFTFWTVAPLLVAIAIAGCLPLRTQEGGQPGHLAYENTIPVPEKKEKAVIMATRGKQEGGTDSTNSPREMATQPHRFSPQEAEEAVRKFGVDDSPKVKGKDLWVYRECYVVTAGPDVFYVETATGRVVYAEFYHVPHTDVVRLSLEEAEAKAKEFLVDHGMIPTEEYRRTYAQLIDHGEKFREYCFSWNKVVKNVWLPSSASVKVNPEDGAIRGFSWQDVKVTVSTTPKIPREQAIAVAKSALTDFDVVKGEVQRLSVTYDHKGDHQQVLAWVVCLEDRPRPAGPGGQFERTLTAYVGIDAHTGKVIFMAGSQK